jgi:hypothetical protein
VNYQSATGLRCFTFSLGAVFAETFDGAMAFATAHGMLDQDAHAQLSLDQQAAYRALGGRRAREAQQARVGEWMTRSVPDDAPGGCPLCGGPLVPLGTLGRVEHFRCRDCGADCHRAAFGQR